MVSETVCLADREVRVSSILLAWAVIIVCAVIARYAIFRRKG